MNDAESFAIYVTSRIKAKRSNFLAKEQFEEMLSQPDAEGVVKVLLASTYEQEMAESLTRFQGADAVEDAVNRATDNMFAQVQELVGGDPEFSHLTRVFLSRWDLAAVKSLLRLRHRGGIVEGESSALVTGPTLNTAVASRFASLESMESLCSALMAWNPELCGRLRSVFAQYNSDGSLAGFEEALDHAYFEDYAAQLGPDGNAGLLRELLQMEIDRINIRTLLSNMNGEAVPVVQLEGRFLNGGYCTPSSMMQIAASNSIEDAISHFEKTRYRHVHRGLYQYFQAGRFILLDRLFEDMFVDMLRRRMRMQVFSMAVLMHYVWVRCIEAVNLRVIARGLAMRLPQGRIREELIYV
jgi:vacuolar-type H+-ATPase subunit C/Vma6